MAELEEEALIWKVHLKGFGTNPLKLPQGVRWRGLRPRFRRSSRAGMSEVGSFHLKFWFYFPAQMFRCGGSGPAPGDRVPLYAVWRGRHGHGGAKIIDSASLSLSRRADASRLRRKSCCFSPSYFSCHFDSIMQDLC